MCTQLNYITLSMDLCMFGLIGLRDTVTHTLLESWVNDVLILQFCPAAFRCNARNMSAFISKIPLDVELFCLSIKQNTVIGLGILLGTNMERNKNMLQNL